MVKLSNELQKLKKSEKTLKEALKNVKELKRIAEEEKDKTLAVIANFSDGLLVFDENNKLLTVNPKAEELLSVSSKKLIGKSIKNILKSTALNPLLALYQKKNKIISREEVKITENLVLEVSIVVLIKERKTGVLVILHNVTREKLIEKMKSEFVSLAAHQLRTPLSAMRWSAKMIIDQELGKINKEQKDFLEESYKSNRRMISLIDDLLNVTKIEEGRYLYNLILSDIELIVRLVINLYKNNFENKKIQFEFKVLNKEIPKVVVDVEKIKMVIENLIDNSIKYTLPRGKIAITLDYKNKNIIFSIKDSGVGILKSQETKIFNKFFRGSNVSKMETEGTGLGLYIAKNIINAHKGKIWFTSDLKKGTNFYFSIPVDKKK